MATAAARQSAPASAEELAAELAGAGEAGLRARVRGAGTKLRWAGDEPVGLELSTARLDRVVEHNAGDLTAVLEAGVPLARAQEQFRAEGQMLALDPPDGGAATIGGVVAANDSGPLRARYGGARDLVLGMRVALADGTIAKSGGKVIKNVAGYDLAKLFTGSYGTLGLILDVTVRLHPKPVTTATAFGASDDADALAAAATKLAALPLEADSLDAAWQQGSGRLLARFGGASAGDQAGVAAERMKEAGLEGVETTDDDDDLWAALRNAQRGTAVLKVSGRVTDLATAIRLTEGAGGSLVSRAAHGLSWIALDADDLARRATDVRDGLQPRPVVLLDGPAGLRGDFDPWGPIDVGALQVMRRIKERFDTHRIFRPGAYLGGI